MQNIIKNKLQISDEEFENLELKKVKINLKNLKLEMKILDNTLEYKYFYFGCIYIAKFLFKINNLKNHIKGLYPEYIRDIKANTDLKSYTNTGYNKFITCKLINCEQYLINKIPKNLLGINIIIVPLYDKIIKMPFQLGRIKLDNNELNIKETYSSSFYNLFFKKITYYVISYSGHADDDHKIEYDDKTLNYTVTESTDNTLIKKNIKKELIIKQRDFDYIVYIKKLNI
jgi:hypothetical protein